MVNDYADVAVGENDRGGGSCFEYGSVQPPDRPVERAGEGHPGGVGEQ